MFFIARCTDVGKRELLTCLCERVRLEYDMKTGMSGNSKVKGKDANQMQILRNPRLKKCLYFVVCMYVHTWGIWLW